MLALTITSAHADTFGSGANTFTIDFVNVGNAGNADDAGAGGGIYSSPYGGVSYDYRIGTYEIPEDAVKKAINLGLTNVSTTNYGPSIPAGVITWFEAAAFVNFLNTSTGHQAAYQINAGVTALTPWSSAQAWQVGGENLFRNKDAYYFLPSIDEWYKAAYHKNDGVTANYWDFATGSNSIPTPTAGGTAAGTAVWDHTVGGDLAVAVNNAGGLSPYGTMAQNGNDAEWTESAFDGTNDSGSENRLFASSATDTQYSSEMCSGNFYNQSPAIGSYPNLTLRVASVVPEPTSAALLFGSGAMLLLRRRRA